MLNFLFHFMIKICAIFGLVSGIGVIVFGLISPYLIYRDGVKQSREENNES